ncbi:MAG: hypothetical protein ABJA37_12215 [Ferruginibacter sp.]
MNKDYRRGVVIPILAIGLSAANLIRVKGSENIRAIHIVTLLAMGFALGVLIMNLITIYRNSKRS